MILSLAIPIILGCLAGYLVNYLADVLPGELKLTHPVCRNPACRKPIPWVDYILLRRCPNCNKPRSLRVFLVLLASIIFTVYLWINPPAKLGFWIGLIIFTYLFLVALIDFETRYVLRPVSLVGLALCLWAGLVVHGWQGTLLGAVAGFGSMLLLYLLGVLFSRWRNKRLGNAGDGEEALGFGDVTLATLLGLLLGWPLIWLDLLIGIILAGVFSILLLITLLISRKYRPLMAFFSFGPFFILTAFFLLYFPKWIAVLLPAG
jgi:prepilin signal peptidase PulO-like enzyme (type II secretory pathway)